MENNIILLLNSNAKEKIKQAWPHLTKTLLKERWIEVRCQNLNYDYLVVLVDKNSMAHYQQKAVEIFSREEKSAEKVKDLFTNSEEGNIQCIWCFTSLAIGQIQNLTNQQIERIVGQHSCIQQSFYLPNWKNSGETEFYKRCRQCKKVFDLNDPNAFCCEKCLITHIDTKQEEARTFLKILKSLEYENLTEKDSEEENEENNPPQGVCADCWQKKQSHYKVDGKDVCVDCYKKRPIELRPLSPNFMTPEELEVWQQLSPEKQQEHLSVVEKKGREKIGKCKQCRHEDLMTIEFLDERYCADCWKYWQEKEKSGINTNYRYNQQRCDCRPCQLRRSLQHYSTRELMIEVNERKDFNEITTWEDDGFLHRFEEVIVELKETEDFEKKRLSEVNEDLFTRGKLSLRKKYSVGT